MRRTPRQWADFWRRTPVHQLPWHSAAVEPELVQAVMTRRLRPCSILDVGCGIGVESVFLAYQGFRVTGIDLGPRAISTARKLARLMDVRAAFRVADALKLPFPRGRFDAAIDRGCFHLVSPAARVAYAAEIHRVLKRRGRLILRCFTPQAPNVGPARLSRQQIRRVFESHFSITSMKTYSSLGNGMPPYRLWWCEMRKRGS